MTCEVGAGKHEKKQKPDKRLDLGCKLVPRGKTVEWHRWGQQLQKKNNPKKKELRKDGGVVQAYKAKPGCVQVSSDHSSDTMRLLALLLLMLGAAGKHVCTYRQTLTRSHLGLHPRGQRVTFFSCCLFCVRVQLQFPAGMARSSADGSASLTPVRSWPPLTTDTTSAAVCSSTTSGCSPSLTVGTSKYLSLEGWWLSHSATFMSTFCSAGFPTLYFPTEINVLKK